LHSLVIHCDGAGSRPDGKGSGFAWVQPHTGERHIERVDGLTNNQAECRALISALTSLAQGSAAQLFTDSQLMCSQVMGNCRVHNAELGELLLQVHDVIKKKELKIEMHWIPRQKNLAGKLL
jgi:ribonuclease HI